MSANLPTTRSEVKSDEEMQMVLWLNEAMDAGLVLEWEYEPRSFTLFAPVKYEEDVVMKTKTKTVTKTLHRGASYTPDFIFRLTLKGRMIFAKSLKIMIENAVNGEIIIDTKGIYNKNDPPKVFSLTQKVMYHMNGIWVSKCIPFYRVKGKSKGLFVDTFAPESLRWMQNEKNLNVMGRSCKSVDRFVSENDDLFG